MTRRFLISAFALALSLGFAATSNTQTLQLERVMRAKLGHSQKILEAVVTSNWGEMEQNARALQALTKDSAWAVLMTPDYLSRTKEFVQATEDLVEAARTRDLEKAPAAYTAMTLSCVRCHRYVARARIAK